MDQNSNFVGPPAPQTNTTGSQDTLNQNPDSDQGENPPTPQPTRTNGEGSHSEPSEEDRVESRIRKWKREWGEEVFINTTIIYAIFFIIFMTLLISKKMVQIPFTGKGILLWQIWMASVAFYTAVSFRTVGTTQVAVKTFFRQDVDKLDSGWTFTPRGIYGLIFFTNKYIILLTGTPNKDDQIEVREGEETRRVNRQRMGITFSSRQRAVRYVHWWQDPSLSNWTEQETRIDQAGDGDNKDPLDERFTGDPHVTVMMRITAPRSFIRIMGSEEEALRAIDQTVRISLQEYCAIRTPAFVLAHLIDAQDYLLWRVESQVGDPEAKNLAETRKLKQIPIFRAPKNRWGVDIISVQITDMGIPHMINIALAKARGAGFESHMIQTLAEAGKVKRTKEGEGKALAAIGEGEGKAILARGEATAAAERKILEQRAMGAKKTARELRMPGAEVYKFDTARAIADKVGGISVFEAGGDGIARLIGTLAAGKSAIDQAGTTPRPQQDDGASEDPKPQPAQTPPPKAPEKSPAKKGGNKSGKKPGPK